MVIYKKRSKNSFWKDFLSHKWTRTFMNWCIVVNGIKTLVSRFLISAYTYILNCYFWHKSYILYINTNITIFSQYQLIRIQHDCIFNFFDTALFCFMSHEVCPLACTYTLFFTRKFEERFFIVLLLNHEFGRSFFDPLSTHVLPVAT